MHMHLPIVLHRCLRQWADYANTAADLAGEDSSNPSLRFCHSFQVSTTVCCACSCKTDDWATTSPLVVFLCDQLIFSTPSLNTVINRVETLCVVPGKTSLSQCIRLMWSCSRESSCSTLRTSETCFRWSCLLIQIQTHGSRAEVCSASLTNTIIGVALVMMLQPNLRMIDMIFITQQANQVAAVAITVPDCLRSIWNATFVLLQI